MRATTVSLAAGLAERGARVVIYLEGGHLWVGHDEDVRNELLSFLKPLAMPRVAA